MDLVPFPGKGLPRFQKPRADNSVYNYVIPAAGVSLGGFQKCFNDNQVLLVGFRQMRRYGAFA